MSEFTIPGTSAPSSVHVIAGDRAVLEQAKGALMLRYGIGSHEAFALLLTWSRESQTPLHTIAHALVNGAGETDHHEPALIRWLQERLSQEISGSP